MDSLLKDIRYGLRMLARKPGFTIAAVLTLALGIGANAAIFSVVNAVLLRPLPFADSNRLLVVWSTNQQRAVAQGEVSLDDYLDFRDKNQAFEEIAAYGPWGFNITGEDEPEKITAVVVTPNLFKTLGRGAAHGRTLQPEEASPGSDKVVVISHDLWQRRYGGDTGLVGRTLTLDGNSYTVVGVMPPEFSFPNSEVDMWAPLSLTTNESSRRSRWLKVIARLKSTVTVEQARSEIETIAGRLAEQYPNSNQGWGAGLAPLHEVAVKDARLALWLLFAAVGVVLLIACVNVANLLLARVESRQKEIAIRAALGARQSRLVRMLFTESVMLALAGGVIGLLVAMWSLDLLVGFIPAEIAPGPDDLALIRYDQIGLDWQVMGFAFLLSLLTGIAFGLAPAWQASRPDLNNSLKEGGRSSGAQSRSRLRSALVISEIALTFMLLIGAGLLVRSFARLQQVDPGFKSENLLTFRLSPASKYRRGPERLNYYQQVIAQIASVPGVERVGATTTLPFTGTDLTSPISIEGRPQDGGERPTAMFNSITRDYFQTMGIPLTSGRFFSDQDKAGNTAVAIVNEALVRRHWPGENPIGQRLSISFGGEKPLEVIGVVGDTQQMGLDSGVRPEVYVPHTQRPWTFMTFVARTTGDPSSLIGTIKGQVLAIDKDVPIYSLATLEQRMSDSVAKRRFNMLLVGLFAGLALVLAAIGIYGVISYTVSLRTHEIGVRMALGAGTRNILRLVLSQGLTLILAGVAVGIVGAVALTRLISNLLFGVSATDALTFAVVCVVMTAMALGACAVPARRATKVDPIVALRYE